MEPADARVIGEGDFDAYHSARHDLLMALDAVLSDYAVTDADRLGTSCPIGPIET